MTQPDARIPPGPNDASSAQPLSVETLERMVEGLLDAYNRTTADEPMADEQMAAIGAAEELVDALRKSRGEVVREVPLPITRFIARARAATTPEQIDVLLAYARGLAIDTLAYQYERSLMRNAASLATEHVSGWLKGTSGGEGRTESTFEDTALENLAKNSRLAFSHAEMVLYALREQVERYPLISSFLQRYPDLLTSVHMEELASDLKRSNERGFSRWGVGAAVASVAVDYLLPKDALGPEEMLLAARHLASEDVTRLRVLALHPSATSEVWCEMASRGKTKGNSEPLRVLLDIPKALADKNTRQAIMDNSVEVALVLRPNMAELALRFPLDAINEPLSRLARTHPFHCLKAIQELPSERRAYVEADALLGEIAATHPDSEVRLSAILLSGTLGRTEASSDPLASASDMSGSEKEPSHSL